MPLRIFISYRRDDSAGHAGRVHDRLEKEFGRDLLFMDVDAIPLGANFATVLSEEVAKCDVLLAVIGPHWLDAQDEKGNRRLERPDDFVRIEIAAALKRGIPVIPVLLEGTRAPRAEQLPEDLKALALRHALDVHHASFHSDMDKLIRSLRAQSAAERMRAEGRIKVDARIIHGAPDGWFKSGAGLTEWFKDGDHAPEMVVVPAGTFRMGSSASEIAALNAEDERLHADREGPQRIVTLEAPFAVGKFAITFDEWDACVADGGCDGYRPNDEGWGRGKRPVINVNWDHAKAYVAWLSRKMGKTYRLLSEAEREYVTRAGDDIRLPYWWGTSISTTHANYSEPRMRFDPSSGKMLGEIRMKTLTVDSFEPNPWGLYQVHGNVWEWCADVWHANYNGAPTDGSPWLQGGDARFRVVRGGSWSDAPQFLRSATRSYHGTIMRREDLGFRVARTLD